MTIRSLLVASLVLLAACDSGDKTTDGTTGDVGTTGSTTAADDADGDGYPASEDCDDANASVNPGAQEVCDGIDNDCDGAVDPETATGAMAWSLDSDGDGFGDPDSTVVACEQPSGAVTNDFDCDDTDADVHPEAIEVCDGIDNDCDALLDDDDDDLDLSTATESFADFDSDGFGDPDLSSLTCVVPSGFVEDNTDCNDTTDTANPDAPEICDDIDNDCDGLVDVDDDSIDLTTTRTFYRDADSDGYGVVDDILEGCSLPSGYSTEPTDCDDTNASVNPGVTEVCNSIDDDCDSLVDDADDSTDLSTGTTYYVDADLDTFGDSADAGTNYCDDPTDSTTTYVTNATDCDDADSAINPDATEVCDAADADEDCNGVADDADSGVDPATQTPWYEDGDGDAFGAGTATQACDDPSDASTTYVATDGDCDDTDSAINPDATEVCDDQDNDCDGDIDDADSSLDTATATAWYTDSDGDGYGDSSASAEVACDAPTDTVDNAEDCNDADSAISPDATEVCDEGDVDEDCNGVADDADSGVDPSTQTDWYTDADSDDYGDSSATATTQCEAPSGTVDDNTDCDDSEATVYPGGREVCDSLDNDCDGLTDDDDAGLDTTTATIWAPDTDGDGYGDDSALQAACVAPSGYISTTGDCDDTDSAINPGATEICDSLDNDCDDDVDDDDDDVVVSGTGSTFYADADGDGYGDESDAGEEFCSTPGTGYTTDNSDCDDGNSSINPAATEVCNGEDDDCDASTTEDGTALWVASGGTTTDYTSTLSAGTSGSPVALATTGDGTLFLCAGTWTTNITVDGDEVNLVGVGGSSAVILDGDAADAVLDVKNGAVVDATGLTLQNGDHSKGGALAVDLSTFTGSDLVLSSSAATEGGGLYVDDATVTLTDCEIDSNTAGDFGGGVFIEGASTVSLDTCDITDNTSSDDGGGLFAEGTSTVDLTSCTISGNSSSDNGGGIEAKDSSVFTLTSCELSSNASGDNGGGIYAKDTSTLDLVSCDFTSNDADQGAGIFVNGNISVDIELTTFTGNEALTGSGGGIRCFQNSNGLALTDVDFISNTATVHGGGIAMNQCDLTMDGGSFTSNTADFGGGLYSYDNVSLTDVDFTTNAASDSGGGLYVKLANGETLTVTRGSFTSNTAASDGGGAYLEHTHAGATSTFDTTAFSSNNPSDIRYHRSNTVSVAYTTTSSTTTTTCSGVSACIPTPL